MDALLALIFVITLILSGVALFVTLWVGSVALPASPQWVADRVVHHFWPERQYAVNTLSGYRTTGAAGLLLALIVTWVVLLGFIQ